MKEQNQSKKKIIEKIGGLALFNGLMLKSKNRECVLSKNNEDQIVINSKIIYDDNNDKRILNKLPILRGILSIIYTIKNSIPFVISSTKNIVDNLTDENEEDIKVGNFEIYSGFVISISLIISFFYIVPNILSSFFNIEYRNIIQIMIELVIFLVYLISIYKTKILNALFEYHGAEHKVVNSYEKFGPKNLTIENVKKSSRFHVRCGGNFVIYFVLLNLILTAVLSSQNLISKTIIEILLTILNIGIAYEIVMLFSKLNGVFKYIAYPAMIIQYITTKEPTDDKIYLAINAMNLCLSDKSQITLKEYINRYYIDNIQNCNKRKEKYDIKDVLRIVYSVTQISVDKLFVDMNTIYLDVEDEIKIFNMLNDMYYKNIPLQYLTNTQLFFKEEYYVNEYVLIPRSDSEILVEKAIYYIDKYKLENMIDMCTGSGCIGISTALNSCIKKALLVDISEKALNVTRKNIIKNNSFNKCDVLNSNLFENIIKKQDKYDIIVSNPPYIKSGDIEKLEENVKKEPIIALDGGINGLDIYIRIFNESKFILNNNGFLIFEIGFDQLEDIKNLLLKYKEYEFIESVKDFGGNDRVIVCRFHQI